MQSHNINERIIYENEHFIILNKPAQLLVHPTPKQPQHTLIQVLQASRPNTSLSLIHRLDRETSGLLIIAKNKITCGALGKMMEARMIKKKYAAIVHGIPQWDQTTVDAPIGFMGLSHANNVYLKQTIKKEGAPAITHLKILQKGQRFSLILAEPITGRLHQIRVHLSSLGHPIVGDKIYGKNPQAFLQFISKGWNQELAQTLLIPRHALHACQLTFEWLSEPHQFSVNWEDDLIQFWHDHEPTSAMPPLIPKAIQ